MSCISHHPHAALVAAVLLPALSCAVIDRVITWEPDAFNTGRPLVRGEVDAAFAVTPSFGDFESFGRSLVPSRAGIGLGLGGDFEVRGGWSFIGTHTNRADATTWMLNAAELRVRRHFLVKRGFRLGAGAGLDFVWGNAGDRLRWYRQRSMLQVSGGWFSRLGLGAFVPVSATYTALRVEDGTGFAVTPGIGIGYETEHFFARFAYNAPFGGYSVSHDSLVRVMIPYYGLQLGGRVRLFE